MITYESQVMPNKMAHFEKALVVTHIIHRKIPPHDALLGPYTAVASALKLILKNAETCQIPLYDFSQPLFHGQWQKEKQLKVPSFLGKLTPLKYILDIFLAAFFVSKFSLLNQGKKKLVIGIDPLSCLPLVFLKKIFNYKLVFYSVDFNKTRFKNKFLQKLYEKADEISSRFSDQTWVVCQSLADYKKDNYQTESIYIPNAPVFDRTIYQKGRKHKTGNKMVWVGSLLTKRQYDILFSTLKKIQTIRPDLEFRIAPFSDHQKFESYGQKYKLKKCQVLDLRGREACLELAAKCDIGIALYDPQFGSTEFIEPLKIWDYLIGGTPFIISSEPSISDPIKKAGVVYFLEANNKIPSDNSLKEFLRPSKIKKLEKKCLALAKEFGIRKQIEKALKKI